MTDFDQSKQLIPNPNPNSRTGAEHNTGQLITSAVLTVSGKQQFMKSGEYVHTVETDEASIKFFGRVSHNFSSSESEEDIEDQEENEQEKDTKDSFNGQTSNVPLNKDELGAILDPQNFKTHTSHADFKSEKLLANKSKLNDTIISSISDSGYFHSDNQESDVRISVDNPVSVNGITVEQNTDFPPSRDTAELCSGKLVKNGNDKWQSQHGQSGGEEFGHSDRLSSPIRDEAQNSPASNNNTLDSGQVHSGGGVMQNRFNPFDRDVVFEEEYFGSGMSGTSRDVSSSVSDTRDFSDGHLKVSDPSHAPRPYSFSSTSDSFSMSSPEHLNEDDEFSFADLGLAEDHFSRPEGHFGMSTLEELEMAMENCKDMIREAPPHTDRHKTLVRKLVQLRLKYQQYKDGPEPLAPDVKLVVGHKFKQRESRSSKHYCEKCNAVIWGMLQVWFCCTDCGYNCHAKCLNQITRTCASVRVSENPSYILSICPERGLAYQNYRCAECRAQISFKSGYSEPRLCDYSGNYYCELCHWNDSLIIPARVLHNWDFEQQKVCRAAKQYLKLMTHRAVLRIQDINPMLFNFVEELDDVKKLREEILIMKKYFLSCKSALDSKLLLQLSSRQHCVENSDMYSLQDLVDVQSDALLPELAKIHSSFAQHIKSDCQLCQAKGFICELCDTHEVLFPFDNIAVVCATCSYVLHRHCYVKRGNKCPRCERRNRRTKLSTVPR